MCEDLIYHRLTWPRSLPKVSLPYNKQTNNPPHTEQTNIQKKTPQYPSPSPKSLYIQDLSQTSKWETCSLDLISRRCPSHRQRTDAVHISLKAHPSPDELRRTHLQNLNSVQLVPHHPRSMADRSVLPDLTLSSAAQAYCCICKSSHQSFWQFRFTMVLDSHDPMLKIFCGFNSGWTLLFLRESTLSSALHQMQG